MNKKNHMLYLFIMVICFFTHFSCSKNDEDKIGQASNEKPKSKAEIIRENIFHELIRFEKTLMNDDKQTMADFFDFPLKHPHLWKTNDRPGTYAEKKATKEFFLQEYDKLHTFKKVKEFFKRMDLSKLKKSKSIKGTPDPNSSQIYFANMSIIHETKEAMFGYGTANGSKKLWVFGLKKKKLKFKALIVQ